MAKEIDNILRWMSLDEKKEYTLLTEKGIVINEAINSGTLELKVKDVRNLKDTNDKWSAKIVDNLDGDSFLYVPNLEFVQKFFQGDLISEDGSPYDLKEDNKGNNRIVKAWRRGSPGYSAGDGMDAESTPNEIILMQPDSYVYHTQGYIEVFANSPKELEKFVYKLKENLMNKWKHQFQDYSFLTKKLSDIRSPASSRKHADYLKKSQQKESSKNKRAIKKIENRKF